MTAHKYAELIKVKADNMELVVFVKNKEWVTTRLCMDSLMFFSGKNYFLCLPQHKEACLHWLNGGDIQVNGEDYCNDAPQTWCEQNDFMDSDLTISIKPEKDEFSELLLEFTTENPISDSSREELIYKLIESFYGSGALIKFEDMKSEW